MVIVKSLSVGDASLGKTNERTTEDKKKTMNIISKVPLKHVLFVLLNRVSDLQIAK